MDTTEIATRNVKVDKYGMIAWHGHLWNFHTKADGAKNLTEYKVRGRMIDGWEANTGLAVRHEVDGSWTARIDEQVLGTYTRKVDAQNAIEHEWLGL